MDVSYDISHYEEVKKKLRDLHYDQPFTIDSCLLVERLLNDVLRAVENFQTLAKRYDQLIKTNTAQQSNINSINEKSSQLKECHCNFPYQGTTDSQLGLNDTSYLSVSHAGSQASTTDCSLASTKSDSQCLKQSPKLQLYEQSTAILKHELNEAYDQLNQQKLKLDEYETELQHFIRENNQLLDANRNLQLSNRALMETLKGQSDSTQLPIHSSPALAKNNEDTQRLPRDEKTLLKLKEEQEQKILQLQNKIESLERALRVERRKNQRQSEQVKSLEASLQSQTNELNTIRSLRLYERKKAREARSVSFSPITNRASRTSTEQKSAPHLSHASSKTAAQASPTSAVTFLLTNYMSSVSPTALATAHKPAVFPQTAAQSDSICKSPIKHSLTSTTDPVPQKEKNSASNPSLGCSSSFHFAKNQTQNSFTDQGSVDMLYSSMYLQENVLLDYLNQLKCNNTFYENHIQELKQQIHLKSAEMEKKDELLTIAQCRIDLLGRNIAYLTQELSSQNDTHKKEANDLKQKLMNCETSIQQMRSLLMTAQKDVQFKLDENCRLATELKRLKQQLSETQSQVDGLKGSLLRAQMVADAQEQQETHLKQVIVSLQKQLQSETDKFEKVKKKEASSLGGAKRSLKRTNLMLNFERICDSRCFDEFENNQLRKECGFETSIQTDDMQNLRNSQGPAFSQSKIKFLEEQLESMKKKLTHQKSAFDALQALCTTLKSQLAQHLKLDFSASNSVMSSVLNSSSTFKGLELLQSSCSSSCPLTYEDSTVQGDNTTIERTSGEDRTLSTLLNTSFNRVPTSCSATSDDPSSSLYEYQQYEYVSLLNLNRKRQNQQKQQRMRKLDYQATASTDQCGTSLDMDTTASSFSTPQPLFIH